MTAYSPAAIRGVIAQFIRRDDLHLCTAICAGLVEAGPVARAAQEARARAELGLALSRDPSFWLDGIAPPADHCIAVLIAAGAGRCSVFPFGYPADVVEG